MRKLNTRAEKVNFLSDLKNGKVSIQQIIPVRFGDVWFKKTSGELANERTLEILNKENLDKKYPPKTVITFK